MNYRNLLSRYPTMSRRSLKRFPWDLSDRRDTSREEWTPVVDVYEEGDRFVLEIDLPGVDRDDLDVSIEQGRLNLEGQRNTTPEAEEDSSEESTRTYYRRERAEGFFRRTFTLPEGLDEESISARLNEGVLTVEMMGAKPATRTIDVEESSPETLTPGEEK